MFEAKYVVIETDSMDAAIIFPQYVSHDTFEFLRPISAGFCSWDERKGWRAFGRSESLNLESNEQDTSLVQTVAQQLGLRE